VYSVARYLIGDDDLAADAVQEVFLKLLRNIHRFHGRSRWTTWLYRVVHNTVHDLRRRRRPELPLSEAAGTPAAEPGAPARVVRRESAERVRRAVERLSPKLREVVLLRYVADLSYEEISGALRISRGTVASRLHRALERLAADVPRDEVEVP
jgi:RNA polymerase sigma-70 factor (ECF subfamily)